MDKLKKLTVIITGAGDGIGRAILDKCLANNMNVIACDINTEKLNELKEYKHNLKVHKVDVSNFEQVKYFFKGINNADVLVNNAGIYLAKNILTYNEDLIDKVIDVNIKGMVYFTQMFASMKLDKKENGRIINISSVSGLEGSSDAMYGMSKAAIIGFTKSCAMNFAPYIKVNAIAPGIVNTKMMKDIPKYRIEEYRKNELINTPIEASDVADSVMFLMSDMSKNYTGATFDINNGCYMR